MRSAQLIPADLIRQAVELATTNTRAFVVSCLHDRGERFAWWSTYDQRRVRAHADGFGKRDMDDPVLWDWSHVRDSSAAALCDVAVVLLGLLHARTTGTLQDQVGDALTVLCRRRPLLGERNEDRGVVLRIDDLVAEVEDRTITLCSDCVEAIGGTCAGPVTGWRTARAGESCQSEDCARRVAL